MARPDPTRAFSEAEDLSYVIVSSGAKMVRVVGVISGMKLGLKVSE